MPKYFKFYFTWAILVLLVVFIKGKASTDNITHFLILVYLGLIFVWYKNSKKDLPINPKKKFIILCVISAAIVEGFYMIHMPVFSGLRITAGMSAGNMLLNYLIDLIFTIPAYFLIFRTIWFLINKYKYNVWQYTILVALGQALGDGSRTFLTNPGLLIFIPYVLSNYHAMNIIPFLKVESSLNPQRSDSFFKYLAPLILLPLVYIICGVFIYTIGPIFGLK